MPRPFLLRVRRRWTWQHSMRNMVGDGPVYAYAYTQGDESMKAEGRAAAAVLAGCMLAGAAAQAQTASQRNVAILIFDGVQIIDYTGPFETFGHVYNNDGRQFEIYTVAPKAGAIKTTMGMSVNPTYTFADAPVPDVLVVPGGDVDAQVDDPAVLRWLQDQASHAEIVMSVCNGAFILAKAGLLDGLEATTTANLIPQLREQAPKTKVVEDKRYVDNGKFITTAGLSSGIDGALHVIDRLYGRGTAQMAALGMEYNWDPDSHYVRAALADKYLQFDYDVHVLSGGWLPLSREGTNERWENRWSVTTDSTAAELLEDVNRSIASNRGYAKPRAQWKRLADAGPATRSLWTFADEHGAPWNGVVTVLPVANTPHRYTLSVSIARQ
jgi:putative intracellular protease/amidase